MGAEFNGKRADAALAESLSAGRGVLAMCGPDCALVPVMMEALAKAGRGGDLRVLHLAYPRTTARFTAASRCPAADTFPTPRTRVSIEDGSVDRAMTGIGRAPVRGERGQTMVLDLGALRPPAWGPGHEPPPGLSVLPLMGIDEILGGNLVVVVSAADGGIFANDYFTQLVLRAGLATEAAGRAPPAVFRVGDWEGRDMRYRPLGGGVMGVRQAALAEPWPEIRREPGLAYAVDGERLVIALDRHVHGAPDTEPRVRAYEVDRDGWVTGVTYGKGESMPERLDRIVSYVMARGTFRDVRAGTSVEASTPLSREAADLLAAGPVVAGIVSAHADIRPAAALSWVRHGQAVLVAARGSRPMMDFLSVWPSFGEMLLEPATREAVAAGARTIPLVAARLGVSEAMARRLAGRAKMPFPVPGHGEDGRAGMLARFLEGVGLDALPRPGDDREWKAMLGCASATGVRVRWMGDFPFPFDLAGSLLRHMGDRDWTSRFARIERWRKAGHSVAGCADFVRGTCEWTTHLLGDAPDGERVLRALAGGRGLRHLIEASIEWHADRAMHEPKDLGAAPWPVPFAPVDLGDGWSARCLSSNAELADEGGDGPDADGIDGLDHCVGGYGGQCRAGTSVIVSLRRLEDGRTVRDSTVELARLDEGERRLPGWGQGYAVVQHLGPGNVPPSRQAGDRLERLKQGILKGEIPFDGDAPGSGPRPDTSMQGRIMAGRAWAEAVFPRYAALFPAPWRDLTVDGFRDLARERFFGPDTMPEPVASAPGAAGR